MRVGYLQVVLPGRDQMGLTRYGRLLAAEARRRPELDVLEVEVQLDHRPGANAARLREAARRLSQVDVVHLQYSRFLWRAGWQQRYYWHAFRQHCPRPLVATLHDVYPYFYPPEGFKAVLRGARESAAPPAWRARDTLGALKNYVLDGMTLRAVARDCSAILVCTAEERRRAAHLTPPDRIKVIPHFVEVRPPSLSRAAARQKLGFDNHRIVTLQGFVYTNKGHRILIEALPELPPEVRVIFAGCPVPGHEGYLRELQAVAESAGVTDRMRVTGYLSDAEMLIYQTATDLAVCPFSIISASSSLSSWVAAARPILASDLPQMAEYTQWVPGAVRTFRPYAAWALAAAIRALLPECSDADDPAVARLREALSMPLVFNMHLERYRQAAAKAA